MTTTRLPSPPTGAVVNERSVGLLVDEVNTLRARLSPSDHAGVVRLIASLRDAVEALSGEWDYAQASAIGSLLYPITTQIADKVKATYPWKETPE